jgi:hypothetical protein
MNSVENLKSTQRRKLFKIFKSSRMQSLNIFGAREGFTFEFTSLSGVWKFENHLTGRARMSVAHFRLTTRDGRPVPHAAPIPGGHRSSPPHVAWPPLPLLRTPPRKSSPTPFFPLPPFSGTPRRRSAPRRPLLRRRCPSPTSQTELSDRAKRSASSPCPSCTKSLPAVPASEAGPRDFPVVVFLREHLAGGSLLRLFLHPVDPAASSAPPRSSSPTSSSTTSTTPSAPHRRLLPVGTRTATESPPPVSTSFPASPPRFSCIGM